MAAPITHIVLADKIFDKYFADKDRREFFVGTSFPDIRYYCNLDRETTHKNGLILSELREMDFFDAGFYSHSFLDEKRQQFYSVLREYPFYLEPLDIMEASLKLFEDELFYDRFNNWTKTIHFFDEILGKERKLKMSERDIVEWHKILQFYIGRIPDNTSRGLVLTDMKFNQRLVGEVNLFIAKIKDDPRVIMAANRFYDEFENMMFA